MPLFNPAQGGVRTVNNYAGPDVTGAQAVAGADVVLNSVTTTTIGSPNPGMTALSVLGTISVASNLNVNGGYINTNAPALNILPNANFQSNVTVSGTITGNRVTRSISANAVAVVTASGSTPADEVFAYLSSTASGATALTIPTLGLTSGQTRRFSALDAQHNADQHPLTISIADTNGTITLNTAGGGVEFMVSNIGGTYKVATYLITVQ